MSAGLTGSGLTTRLFLEGIEVDLTADIDINNTYAISDVKSIGSKNSSYSKSITVPGTANNNKLFAFLFDIKSTGSNAPLPASGYTGTVINLISGVTVTNVSMAGASFATPINNGFEAQSFHNQFNDVWFIDISGNTNSSGYVICSINGNIIASNKINGSITRYYFPQGFYLYNDQLQITLQTTPQPYSGNIGYDVDFRKKMRAYVLQDNAIILSGYAKMLNAVTTNGLGSYQLQITSDLGGFIASLANLRLEDLFSTIAPDLVADPTGNVSKSIDLPTPYDHILSIPFITATWFETPGLARVVYPVIDYGNDDTVGGTNFYTSTLRPAIFAKDYVDLIFQNAGYTYSSTFLNSTYFQNLIIPYKDGNMSITNTFPVDITSNATSGTTVILSVSSAANSFYIYNTIVTDQFNVYVPSNEAYVCQKQGIYNVSIALQANYKFSSVGNSGTAWGSPHFIVFVIYEIYHTGAGSPYVEYEQLFDQAQFTVLFGGNPATTSANITSDTFNISLPGFPIFVATPGDFIKVRFSATAPHFSGANFIPEAANPTILFTGTAVFQTLFNTIPGQQPDLQISYSSILDNQTLVFKDFVPKDVKQIDYINSIVKLFNLYPEQDPNIKNHFNIYTRDEFFSNQTKKDWTNKLDLLSNYTVKPIPELDSAQLLFSYKKDKDWWNKQYDSLYGDFTYGALRVQTGYDFANKVNDVMSGLIFSPTPMVQYGQQSAPSEGPIEILNEPFTFPNSDTSSNIIMAAGYFAANGQLSPNSSSIPLTNNFSGTKFTKAKVGVHILYWGVEYIISLVYNDWAFAVTDINGNNTVLRRPITQGSTQRISQDYYATNDGFTYITNSNITIPAIYDSSDNNLTHKPVKTEMRILHFKPLNGNTAAAYNSIFLQYTPITISGIYQYQGNGNASGVQQRNQIPFCSHLDDPIAPTKDLLFAAPIALFFPFPFNGTQEALVPVIPAKTYPTYNLYSRYWVNTVNEILDKDAKFVDCSMNLNSVDIANLDLSALIFINGTNHRINKITDYSPDSSLTQVELLRLPKFVQTTPFITVNAGPDQVISGSTTGVLFGSVSWGTGESDGEVAETILWTQVSGPSGVTISPNNSLVTTIFGLTSGSTYVFNLFVVDNYGSFGNDQCTVIATVAPPCSPFVFAENFGDVTLPNSVNELSGVTTACPPNTIVSNVWTQISGSTLTIVSPTLLATFVSGITAPGSYTFRLTATDNLSNVMHADTSFTVFAAAGIIINNVIASAGIASVSGIPSLVHTSGPTIPFSGIGTFNGTHGAVSGTVTIVTSGTIPPGSFHMTYKLNGTVISTQTATSAATYFFTVSALSTDVIDFELST